VLRQIDFLSKICNRFLAYFTCEVKLLYTEAVTMECFCLKLEAMCLDYVNMVKMSEYCWAMGAFT